MDENLNDDQRYANNSNKKSPLNSYSGGLGNISFKGNTVLNDPTKLTMGMKQKSLRNIGQSGIVKTSEQFFNGKYSSNKPTAVQKQNNGNESSNTNHQKKECEIISEIEFINERIFKF